MEAGKELNVKVAEDVMWCRYAQDETFDDMEIDDQMFYNSLQSYSEDFSAAWQVMEKMKGYNELKIASHKGQNLVIEIYERVARHLGYRSLDE